MYLSLSLSLYIYIYIYILLLFMYIYIWRERERERDIFIYVLGSPDAGEEAGMETFVNLVPFILFHIKVRARLEKELWLQLQWLQSDSSMHHRLSLGLVKHRVFHTRHP